MSSKRRGRGMRGPLAWPRVPAMRSRSDRFDEVVLDAFERVCDRAELRKSPIELAVEDVPPSDPAPWEDQIALARAFPAQNSLPARVVVYRRPIETRAATEAELVELIHLVMCEQIAGLLGIDPDELKD
ncbi:metallopeptidase family protein [Yimella sp. cx-573]|nr:metallopeptidase family protein [Yimella sp. cx-573]